MRALEPLFSKAMVVLEFAALKLAATGASGTAAAIVGPPPIGHMASLPTPLDAAVPASGQLHPVATSLSSWLWPKMAVIAEEMGDCGREICSTAVSSSQGLVQAGIPQRALELLCASAAVYGVLGKFGFLEQKSAVEDDEDGIPTVRRYRDLTIYPIALSAFAISDVLKLTAVVDSIGAPLTMPLRLFAIGGILLSFPADAGIAWAKNHVGFRKALFIELAACTVSLFWLTWGTHLLSVSPGDALNAPLLFWACFVHCVLTWSGFSSIIAITILSSAVTAFFSTQSK